jgi:hypothetical protein
VGGGFLLWLVVVRQEENMIVRWDEVEFDLPERAVEGLRTYVQSVAEAMACKRGENPECWTWGRCWISDISNARGIEFQWGGDDFPPKDGAGAFAVLSKSSGDST